MSNKQCVEIFADDIMGVMLGYPMSKLTFASSVQTEPNGKASKIPVVAITMSTQSMVTALNFVLEHVNMNKGSLMDSASESAGKMLNTLEQKAIQKVEKKKAPIKKLPLRLKAK